MCTHKYIYTHAFRDVTYNILLHPIFLSQHQHVLHRKPAVTAFAQGGGGNMRIWALFSLRTPPMCQDTSP